MGWGAWVFDVLRTYQTLGGAECICSIFVGLFFNFCRSLLQKIQGSGGALERVYGSARGRREGVGERNGVSVEGEGGDRACGGGWVGLVWVGGRR